MNIKMHVQFMADHVSRLSAWQWHDVISALYSSLALVPETTNQMHLNLLAQLADCFSNDQFRHKLQMGTDASELFEIASKAFTTAAT